MSQDILDRSAKGVENNEAEVPAGPVRPALLAGEEREAPERHIFRGTD